MINLKNWMIQDIANSAYRHGQGYAKNNIYRHVGKFSFKNPEVIGLPDWVIQLDLDTHKFLADLYKHAFRQGLRG